MKKLLVIILSVFAFSTKAQVVRKYSNEFLNIGVGANNLGMGNAVVASTADVTSAYWNPAGLLKVKSNFQAGLMHSEYFAGIAKYDYGAVVKPLDENSAAAFSIVRFGVDNIPNTTQLIDANGQINYDRVTTFSAADYAFLFSYAKKMKIEGLHVGANAKVIRRKVGDFAGAWGFGLDAGAQYQKNGWLFGAMAKDVTTTFNAWSFDLTDEMKEAFVLTGNEIPTSSVELTLPKLILGAARNFSYKKFTALTELNMDATFDGKRNVLIKSKAVSLDPKLGVQIGYSNIVFLRGGLSNFQKIKEEGGKTVNTIQPNFGVGVKIRAFTLDYALTNVGENVGLLSNVFSLKIDLNPKQTR
ncbi:MAG: PorV/PorQ family protein [Bacteroidota bacterium]